MKAVDTTSYVSRGQVHIILCPSGERSAVEKLSILHSGGQFISKQRLVTSKMKRATLRNFCFSREQPAMKNLPD